MNQKKIIRICAVLSGISGLLILFSTIYPIVAYEWEASKKYPILLSPIVDKERGKFTFDNTDYTKAENWFPVEDGNKVFGSSEVLFFTISIPRLKIDNASVVVGGDDLSEHLVQYPGTALPGKVGNTVIFGHSILPIYFDPENYLSIFSTLPSLDKGDLVYTNFDGVMYKYIVEDMFEVRPSDIQILEQDSSDSFLSLVTCTPPGHPLKPKRLIVRARIVSES